MQEHARVLLADYLLKHADRLPNAQLYAALCAAASRVAQHGPPPDRWQRLGYRTAKRNKARKRMIEDYGDPAAPIPVGSRT